MSDLEAFVLDTRDLRDAVWFMRGAGSALPELMAAADRLERMADALDALDRAGA